MGTFSYGILDGDSALDYQNAILYFIGYIKEEEDYSINEKKEELISSEGYEILKDMFIEKSKKIESELEAYALEDMGCEEGDPFYDEEKSILMGVLAYMMLEAKTEISENLKAEMKTWISKDVYALESTQRKNVIDKLLKRLI